MARLQSASNGEQAQQLGQQPALPTRNGVSPSCVALPPGAWLTKLDFLAERFAAVPRAEWAARMAQGEVLDEHGQLVGATDPYQPQLHSSRLYYYRSLAAEPRIPFDEAVLFQDDFIVVADKPHFLPVIPSGSYVQETLLVRLKRRLRLDTLVPMHRIDRETAGLVVFIVQPATRDAYQALFRPGEPALVHKRVTKHYEAIAPLNSSRSDITLEWPLDYRSRMVEGDSFMQMREDRSPGALANTQTHITLLGDCGAQLGHYRLQPVTGRKHQLRVHMAALGLPIVGDTLYPHFLPERNASDGTEPDYSQPLQLLAKRLSFTDPISGEVRSFESQLRLALLG